MKTRFLSVLIGLAVMFGSHSAVAQCDPSEEKILFSHVVATKGHPKGQAAAALADRVNLELDGEACMEVYPNAELYSDDATMFEALIQGNLQMAAPSLSKFEDFTKVFRVFDLPFLFEDIHAVERFQQSEVGQGLMLAMRRQGILGLAYWHNGMKQMSATQPLRRPEDASGLRFRVQQSDVLVAQMEALGATGVKMAFRDVHDALRDGQVEGQENTWSNIFTKQFYRHQAGVTETNHGIIDYLVVASRRWWQGLPQGLRNRLGQILLEVTHEHNRFAFEINEFAKLKILENGGVVRRLRQAEREAWLNALRPVWAQFEGDIGARVIQAAERSNSD